MLTGTNKDIKAKLDEVSFVEDNDWGGRNVIECKKNEQDVIEIDDFAYSEIGKQDADGKDESLFLFLSLPLSLSLSHTHTHTRTHTQKKSYESFLMSWGRVYNQHLVQVHWSKW